MVVHAVGILRCTRQTARIVAAGQSSCILIDPLHLKSDSSGVPQIPE